MAGHAFNPMLTAMAWRPWARPASGMGGVAMPRFAPGSDVMTAPAAVQRNSRSSIALSNLRGVTILIVVAFHSALAYLGSLGPSPFSFDAPPYQWRAFPIVDGHRFYGFDIFCAWQDVYLMGFMFFLSALFTWPSLSRKGTGKFLTDRFLRIGVPYLFALAVMAPIALWPVYRLSAADPSVIDYARHYLALPFIPNGPAWFLWQLLALTFVAACLHRFAPRVVATVADWSAAGAARPGHYFLGLAAASAIAYVPLALLFTPFAWANYGPLALQYCRPLLYLVLYLAGLGIGAVGLEHGMLAPDGKLARQWRLWLAVALTSFVFWMAMTALAMHFGDASPFALNVIVDIAFAIACCGGCFLFMAACLRFGTRRAPILSGLATNAFGIYLLHYIFVVWLQYALLGAPLFAVIKFAIVFGGALSLAWISTVAMRATPFGRLFIGEAPAVTARSGNPVGRRPLSSSAVTR
jgi:glucan biosynthesis protein C